MFETFKQKFVELEGNFLSTMKLNVHKMWTSKLNAASTAIKFYDRAPQSSSSHELIPSLDIPYALNKRVLVVDDSESVRSLIVCLLTASGFDVVEASCGEEGIETFLDNPVRFDLIISDYSMPDMDGIAMCEQLRVHGFASKVILVSGYLQDLLEARNGELPDVYYLAKPFSAKHLYAVVNKALGTSLPFTEAPIHP